MNNTDKLNLMKQRLKKLESSEKSSKFPGVSKALRREIRKLEETIKNE